MSDVVLDSSAILAVVFGEAGSEQVERHLPGPLVSSVSLAEVVGRLVDRGSDQEEIRRALGRFELLVIPFDPEHAWKAGVLRAATRAAGLSLGDRACLALALSRGVPAVTCDRSWALLGLGAAVKVVGR